MELWQQELRDTIRTLEQLQARIPSLPIEELRAVIKDMRLAITPHSAKLIDFQNPEDPLFKICVPHTREILITPEELVDPIGDEAKSPIPYLTHRYPDRVLLYATFFCALSCRFCFRRFKTGQTNPGPNAQDLDRIVQYLNAHQEVDEVILTGGDPLTLVDAQLEDLFQRIRSIPTIARIRIHTRVPVNIPSRITPALTALLTKYQDATHPLYIVTHFNHAREIAPENIEAIARLVDAGIVVRNQHVLLRGINDSVEVLTELYKKLANIRVVCYYIHQLDLARGTSHFRVPLERGLEFMRALQGHLSGIMLPKYMLDLPGGKGKVPLQPEYLKKIGTRTYEATPFTGETIRYEEPSI
jgi:lysine 2,3-aminomutase